MSKISERENRQRSTINAFLSEENKSEEEVKAEEIKDDSEGSESVSEGIQIKNIEISSKKSTKSKRVNFCVFPEVYKDFSKICKKMGISNNDAVNQLMKNFVDANK